MDTKVTISPLSQYDAMDSAYWGLGATKDVIYFALCTHQPRKSAMVFQYKQSTKAIKPLFNLGDHIKNSDTSLPQGKVHTPIFAGRDGIIYFGTHFAYPYGKPKDITYDGGHIVSYNPKKNIVNDLGIAEPHEGILALIMDTIRNILYMVTAPSFHFISYDITEKKYHNWGIISKDSSICRTLTLDDHGNVYGSYEQNKIFQFNREKNNIEYLSSTLPADQTIQEWQDASRGGVNRIGRNIWRSAVWNKDAQKIYGIHGGTSKLFSFDPKSKKVEDLEFVGSYRDKDTPEAIYPTLSLAEYSNVLFYVPASGFFDYARSSKIKGYSHLISYDVNKRKRTDLGEIADVHGRRIFGVAGSVMSDIGKFYLLGAVEVIKDEMYNKQNILQGKPFHLSLIEIDIHKFI